MELNNIKLLSPKLRSKIDRIVKQWIETNLSDEHLSTEITRLLNQSLETAIMTWLGFERNTWNSSWQLARQSGKPLPDALTQRSEVLMAEVIKQLDFQPEEVLSKAEIKSMRTTYRRELIDAGQEIAARRGYDDGRIILDRILDDVLDDSFNLSVKEALEDYDVEA
jgi:hypothetical protein